MVVRVFRDVDSRRENAAVNTVSIFDDYVHDRKCDLAADNKTLSVKTITP